MTLLASFKGPIVVLFFLLIDYCLGVVGLRTCTTKSFTLDVIFSTSDVAVDCDLRDIVVGCLYNI
jgi:hypothetical protein